MDVLPARFLAPPVRIAGGQRLFNPAISLATVPARCWRRSILRVLYFNNLHMDIIKRGEMPG